MILFDAKQQSHFI